MTFNVIISRIFPEIFIETPQVVQKIWRLFLLILTVFIDFHWFLDFLTFPCNKETNDVTVQWYWNSSSWNMKGGGRQIIIGNTPDMETKGTRCDAIINFFDFFDWNNRYFSLSADCMNSIVNVNKALFLSCFSFSLPKSKNFAVKC